MDNERDILMIIMLGVAKIKYKSNLRVMHYHVILQWLTARFKDHRNLSELNDLFSGDRCFYVREREISLHLATLDAQNPYICLLNTVIAVKDRSKLCGVGKCSVLSVC